MKDVLIDDHVTSGNLCSTTEDKHNRTSLTATQDDITLLSVSRCEFAPCSTAFNDFFHYLAFVFFIFMNESSFLFR